MRASLSVVVRASCAFFFCAFGSGCMHITSEVPGVLDLRSDGADSDVRAEAVTAGDASRDGIMGFFAGTGAQVTSTGGSDVTIVDRNSLVAVGPLILMSVLNSSSTEEWNAALQGGALRNVTIGEQISPGAVGATLVKGVCLCPAIGGWVAPTIDFNAGGTRINLTPAAASERDTSIPPALPSDGSLAPASPTSLDGQATY